MEGDLGFDDGSGFHHTHRSDSNTRADVCALIHRSAGVDVSGPVGGLFLCEGLHQFGHGGIGVAHANQGGVLGDGLCQSKLSAMSTADAEVVYRWAS